MNTIITNSISEQMEAYNETINSTYMGDRSVNCETVSDGYCTKQFLRGLLNKENTNPTQLSSETFIVDEPRLDETIIKDNPMHGYQNTMYAHAVNKLAARMRRQNPHLHQGSFSLEKSSLSEFDLTPSELPGESTIVSESFLYSDDDEEATIVDREEIHDDDSTTDDTGDYCSDVPAPSTYINIDNYTVDSRYVSEEPSLPVIDVVNGRQVQIGTKSRKPRRPASDIDPEISFAFADLQISNKPPKRLSSTRLDYTKVQETPTSRSEKLIRPTFSAPPISRTR